MNSRTYPSACSGVAVEPIATQACRSQEIQAVLRRLLFRNLPLPPEGQLEPPPSAPAHAASLNSSYSFCPQLHHCSLSSSRFEGSHTAVLMARWKLRPTAPLVRLLVPFQHLPRHPPPPPTSLCFTALQSLRCPALPGDPVEVSSPEPRILLPTLKSRNPAQLWGFDLTTMNKPQPSSGTQESGSLGLPFLPPSCRGCGFSSQGGGASLPFWPPLLYLAGMSGAGVEVG